MSATDIFATINNESDIAYSWVTTLFDTSDANPLAAAFFSLSSTLTVIGAALMGWWVLSGVVSTAYTGKVLGEKWHQIWAPLRVIIGFGLLVPVDNGFSSVHFLLKEVVAKAAINLGNAPINAYVDSSLMRIPNSKLLTTVGSEITNDFMQKIICTAVVNNYNSYSLRAITSVSKASLPAGGTNVVGSVLGAGDITSLRSINWDFGVCGRIVFNDPDIGNSEIFKNKDELLKKFVLSRNQAVQTLYQTLAGSGENAGIIDYNKMGLFFAAHGDWFDNSNSSNDLITQFQTEGIIKADFVTKLSAAAKAYNDSLSAASSTLFHDSIQANISQVKERLSKYGFMAAGSYERTLSTVSSLAVSVSNERPSMVSDVVNNALISGYTTRIDKALAMYNQALASNPSYGLDESIWVPTTRQQVVDYVLAKVLPQNIFNMQYGVKSSDPIGDMISFGHILLAAVAAGILAVLAGDAILGNVAGAALGGIPVALDISKWIGYALMIMLVVGILHSYVIPMLPMMMVFIMGVSWLTLFLEAAIAGVLWSFAFIRMDGHEFIDRNQAPGLTLLFNLLLRPAISMLAYVAGLVLLPVILNSLTEIWYESYNVQAGTRGFVFLFQWIAGVVLFSYMQWHLMLRVYGLIPTISDRVGHWMGFGNMHGYNEGQETHAAVGAAVGAGMAISRAPILPSGGGGFGRSRGGGPTPGSPGVPHAGQLANQQSERQTGANEMPEGQNSGSSGASSLSDGGSSRGANSGGSGGIQMHQSQFSGGGKGEKGESGQAGAQGRDGRDGKSDTDK